MNLDRTVGWKVTLNTRKTSYTISTCHKEIMSVLKDVEDHGNTDVPEDFLHTLSVVLSGQLSVSWPQQMWWNSPLWWVCLWLIHLDECLLFLAWQEGQCGNAFYYPSGWRWMADGRREMWCLGVHSSLPHWGVKDGGFSWLVLSLFVQSSESSHWQIANRIHSIWEEWFPLGFTN